MTTGAASKPSVWKGFTAVDFVTIAVFAAIYRACWYLWHAFGYIAPFNQLLNAFLSVGLMFTVMIIIRKLGAAMLFSIASQAINLFLQGEALPAAILYLSWGVLADLYVWIRLAAGADPFSNWTDLIIAIVLTAIVRSVSDWYISYIYIFLTPIPAEILRVIVPTHILAGIVGGWAGVHLGNRVRGVIG